MIPSRIIPFVLLACTFMNDCAKKTDDEEFRARFLAEVNNLRSQGCFCGEDSLPPVQPVRWDDALEAASTRHVEDMAAADIFSHIGTDGSTPPRRALEAGFEGAYIGENIARGYITIADVMKQWKNSESHCKTMMDGHFNFMAVAYEEYYWVQMFGSD